MRTKYIENRNKLIAEATKLAEEGKISEAENKYKEVEDLDTTYKNQVKILANLKSLEDSVTVNDLMVNRGIEDMTFNANPMEPKDENKSYLNAWAKDMLNQPLDESEREVFNKFNNAVQTGKTHTVIIPETVVNGIWREAGELYAIFGDVKPTYVEGDMTIIKETNSGADADWYDEETPVVDGEVAFGELNLTGCELAKSVTVSWKLRKMSIEQFIPYITTILAEKMGAALSKAIITGKGKPSASEHKPQPRGIKVALLAEGSTPQVVTYTGSIGYEQLTSAMALIAKYSKGACFYADSTTIWGQLAQIKDAEGRPLFIPDVTTGGVGRIFGLVVKSDDTMPAGEVLAGNVSRGYAMNINQNVSLYSEEHIKTRTTDYMAYAIVDGDLLTTKAFAYIKK